MERNQISSTKAGEKAALRITHTSRPSMAEKRNNRRWRVAQGLALFFSLTYLVLFADVLLEHHIGLVPVSAAKLVPVVFSPLAAGVALATGLWPRRETLYAFAATMGLSVLVGLAGAYFHLASSLPDFTVSSLYAFPPKLAPLAFSGVGVTGLLVTFGFFKPTWENSKLLFDPVCRRHFPKAVTEVVVSINGETYGLCCPMCEEEFRKRGGLTKPAA